MKQIKLVKLKKRRFSTALGNTWNKVVVSGNDTGFILDAEAGQLKVGSKNSVSVTILGENVDSDKTSGKQTITASSSGTIVTKVEKY
ncbi:MAG: hypothetical protein K2N78_12045 [Oscillospiraceae bacterium]|nr:hypothetical protein [Oscillospiraceae bacterium]